MPIEIRGLNATIATLTKDIETTVNTIADGTGDEVEERSPVDTGFFRFNWNKSYGAPRDRVRGVRQPDQRYGPPTFDEVGSWFVNSGAIYFANAVDYAIFLDGAGGRPGSSPQARQGVTEPVAAVIDSRFDRVD